MFRFEWNAVPDGGGEAHPGVRGLPHPHQPPPLQIRGALTQEN